MKLSLFFKLKNYAIISLLLATTLMMNSCTKSAPKTPAEQISGKEWKVVRAFLNGNPDNTGNYSGFQIRFNFIGDNGGSYTITPALAPSKPNLTRSNSGTWVIEDSNIRMTMDKGTSSEASINLIAAPTETTLTMEWQVPVEVDKTSPTRRYELVPVQ